MLHEKVELMHLDLRLDNMLVSRDGVAFVDFGSAAREGEDLGRNPLLKSLFNEIMQTSEIQRVLSHMAKSGQVTSQTLLAVRGKADLKLDMFYLAVQMARPTTNPDIAQLVEFDAKGDEARLITQLCNHVLRPGEGDRFETASDLLNGLKKIQRYLQNKTAAEKIAVGSAG